MNSTRQEFNNTARPLDKGISSLFVCLRGGGHVHMHAFTEANVRATGCARLARQFCKYYVIQ